MPPGALARFLKCSNPAGLSSTVEAVASFKSPLKLSLSASLRRIAAEADPSANILLLTLRDISPDIAHEPGLLTELSVVRPSEPPLTNVLAQARRHRFNAGEEVRESFPAFLQLLRTFARPIQDAAKHAVVATPVEMMDFEFETLFKLEFVGKLFAGVEPRPDSIIWTLIHDPRCIRLHAGERPLGPALQLTRLSPKP